MTGEDSAKSAKSGETELDVMVAVVHSFGKFTI